MEFQETLLFSFAALLGLTSVGLAALTKTSRWLSVFSLAAVTFSSSLVLLYQNSVASFGWIASLFACVVASLTAIAFLNDRPVQWRVWTGFISTLVRLGLVTAVFIIMYGALHNVSLSSSSVQSPLLVSQHELGFLTLLAVLVMLVLTLTSLNFTKTPPLE